MKYLIILLVLFSSCINQKKVTSWLNNHPTEAAGYCADKYPPDTISRVITKNVDSADYFNAYMNMSYLADSLFYKLDSIQHLPPAERPKINIDSVRKAVDKEIRKRLKPCIDTVKVVTNTVVDRAKETALKYLIDEKDKVITGQQKDIKELNDKVKAKNKWIWMFWGLVVLCGLYTLLKLRFKLPI
jgi:hypothetical protein